MLPNYHKLINPLNKPSSSNYYTLPYRSKLQFLISDIWALWRKCQSAQMSEIKNGINCFNDTLAIATPLANCQ